MEKLFPKNDINNPGNANKNESDAVLNTAASTSKPETMNTENTEAGPSKRKKPSIDINKYIPVVLPKGKMLEKLNKAAPYNFFLTAITDSKPTHEEPLTITMQGIYFVFMSPIFKMY